MDLSGLPPESEAAGRAPALAQPQHTNHHQAQDRASRLSLFLSSFSPTPIAHKDASESLQPHAHKTTTTTTRSPGNYVNLELVREMIAQHAIEFMIILVIIIYLVYYFSKISRKPKLIGNTQSPFVASIKENFKQTLRSRFSPLIYFWGTNPQTALFGYLQGQTSNDEMPRSKFHRQFLYVSDAQYLASNIDLSEHYERCMKRRLSSHHQIFHHHHHLDNIEQALPLEKQTKEQQQQLSPTKARAQNDEQSLLHQNIQMVMEGAGSRGHALLTRTASGGDCSDSSAIGSSSDSGVFAGENTSASSSSSSSSRSSLTIDMSSVTSSPPSRQSKSSTRSDQSSSTASDGSQAISSTGCDLCNSSLYEQPSENSLDEELQLMNNKTPPSLMSGHNNTNKQQHRFKREQFEFGQCALDWFVDSHEQYHRSKSVALISAGMTTGSDKKYVTDTVQTLHKLGYEVCVFIRRGVGGLKLNSTKFFSPSKWRDFETAILSIKRQRPNCRLVSIGFSFGSIELCRYLSMSGTRSLVDLALLISCPFDPEAGGRNMRKRALNRKIDAYLAKNLGKQLHQALSLDDSTASESSTSSSSSSSTDEDRTTLEMMVEEGQKQQQQHKNCNSSSGKGSSTTTSTSSQQVHVNYNGSIVDLSSLPKIKSLVDFEDNYNRVIQHYPNSDAYGADSRLNDQLANIRTPTLCLSSEDDFMAPVKLLPIKQIEANENLCMILTKRGGHMAFIDGLVWPKRPYYAQRIIEEYMKLPPPLQAG